MHPSRRKGGLACYIRKTLCYNPKSGFCSITESIFIDIFCLNQDQF